MNDLLHDLIHSAIGAIERHSTLIHTILRNQEAMSVSISDIIAAISKASTDTQTLLTDIAAQVAALKAEIVALQGQAAPDLAPALAAIQALDATITAATPVPAAPAA